MRRPGQTSSTTAVRISSRTSGSASSGPIPPHTGPDDAGANDDGPVFPSLKRRPPEDRAREVVDALKEAILNPGRADGGTGMAYQDWAKVAHKKITRAVREAEASASLRELMSAHRIGGMCLRIGFLLLAAVASFSAFWFGIVFVWRTYGAAWGMGATMSAIGLSLAFVVAGLLMSNADIAELRSKVRGRFDLDD